MPITGPIPLPGSMLESMLQGAELAQTPFKSALLKAQTKREEAKANMPFGGQNLPGAAGQIVGLETIKMAYGEDSPQYKEAKGLYDLNKQSTQSRINYQNLLSETAPKRFSTPLAKTIQELEDIKNGYLPGTKENMNDEQKKYYEGIYGLDLLKKTTDTDVKKRNLFSKNMDITINSIDPVALTQYSGIQGALQLLQDKALDLRGETPERYEKYQNSLTAAKTLAKQVRQFYGDSITPQVQEGLRQLTDPSAWLKSPKIALSNYNAFVKLLRAETGTYQKATQSPEIYTGQSTGGAPTETNQENNEPMTPDKVTSSDELAAGEVGIYSPEGTLVARGTKKQAAAFLKDHKGYYQKVID